MNVYFVYKVLTNRIRALIIAAGYIKSCIRHVIKRPHARDNGVMKRVNGRTKG